MAESGGRGQGLDSTVTFSEGEAAELRDARDAPAAARTTVGRYRVIRELGAGGMGVVVAAHDPELDREVALKLVRPEIGDRAYRERLIREARAMAQLDHPNVVRVFDAGLADGEVFVAMELVRGETLGGWLRAARRPWREVVARFLDAGRGLAAAHAAGLVHRDFKPDNVLLDDRGDRARVTDFGLAVPSASEPTAPAPPRDPAITATGAAAGTPPYMAPEQHTGGDVDARTDVFSFCVSLHEGVYGQRPFAPRAGEPWVDAVARGPRAAPRDRRVPAAVRRVIVRGLAVDPAARWPAMTPLLAALERIRARRRRLAIAAVAIAGLAGVGALAIAARGRAAIDPCAADAAAVDRVWSPARAAHVRAALVAGGQVFAAGGADRAIAALDGWSGAWRDARAAACRDPEVAQARARAACLDAELAGADARVALLETAAPDVVVNAPAIATVASPAECASPGRETPPADPVRAARVQAGWARLAHVEALYSAGRYGEAEDAVTPQLADADALGSPRLADAIRIAAARCAQQRDEVPRAEALWRAVAESAAARGDDSAVALAWRGLVVARYRASRFDGIDDVITAARAAAHRTGSATAEASVGSRIAAVLADDHRLDDADAACTHAQAIAAAHPEITPGDAYDIAACAIIVADRRGRATDMLAATERRFAAHLRAVGPRHPDLANDLQMMAQAQTRLDRRASAAVLGWTAYRLVVDAYGERTDGAITAAIDLSFALMSSDDPQIRAQALALADRFLAAAGGLAADDPLRDQVLGAHAQVRAALGDAEGATTEYAAAWARISTAPDASVPIVVAIANEYAQLLRQHGHCDRALPVLAQVLARADLPANARAPLTFQHAACSIDPASPAGSAAGVAELEPLLAALRVEDLGPQMIGNFERLDAMGLAWSGRAAEARPHLERALALFRGAHPDAFTALVEHDLATLRAGKPLAP